jgi:hypothetical protein
VQIHNLCAVKFGEYQFVELGINADAGIPH